MLLYYFQGKKILISSSFSVYLEKKSQFNFTISVVIVWDLILSKQMNVNLRYVKVTKVK